MSCPLCGDETVHRDVATTSDPLLLMAVEGERLDWMEHLRSAHPEEHAREHAKETEMNEALARVFGRRG